MIANLTRRAFWLLLWALGLGLTACEENTVEPTRYGALSGVVRDSRTNAVLPNAVITTNPATTSFTSDGEGRFSLPNLAVGQYALSVRKTDYKTETLNVQVAEGPATSVDVRMEKSTGNQRPNVPSQPQPATGAVEQNASLTLRWRGSDPDHGDSLRYDVVLYESNSSVRQQPLSNGRDSSVTVSDLKYNTTYYWQVTVRDKAGETTRGDVWTFRTKPFPELRYLFTRETGGNTDIYAADGLANGTVLRLTSSAFVETMPQLSPIRDRIAYTSNATGQYHIYTMNRDGSDARRVTTIPVEGYSNNGVAFRWSPDGSQFIYARYDQLYRVNRDGTGLQLLATAPAGRHFRELDWSALSNKIVIQTIGANVFDAEIYQLNPDGTGLAPIVGNLPGRLDSPSFSVDGRQISYTRDVAGIDDPTGRQLNAHIFVQRPDGSGLTDLSTRKPAGTNDLNPRFSPDGSKIIFTNVVNDNITAPEVWMMDATDGNNRVRIFQNAALPDWR
jgi:TolB protein